MKRATIALLASCLAALALSAPAQASFGIRTFEVSFSDQNGEPAEAGSHPFALSAGFGTEFDEGTLLPEGWIRDLLARQPTGFVGDTTAYPRCSTAQFLSPLEAGGDAGIPACPLATQVGAAAASLKNGAVSWLSEPLFNLTPPPGTLVRLGFRIKTQNIFIDIRLNPYPPYNALAASRNNVQIFPVFGAVLQLWGNPSDPGHDELRRGCLREEVKAPPPAGDIADFQFESDAASCAVAANPRAFLTMPVDCSGPLITGYEALSWEGDTDSGSVQSPALHGCEKLGFKPTIEAKPTTAAAETGSGLDFSLDFSDEGLTNPDGVAQSDRQEGRSHPAAGGDDQPLRRRRPRRLHARRARPRNGRLRPGGRLSQRLQARHPARPLPAGRRTDRGPDLLGPARRPGDHDPGGREPLRQPDRALHRAQEPQPRSHRQSSR